LDKGARLRATLEESTTAIIENDLIFDGGFLLLSSEPALIVQKALAKYPPEKALPGSHPTLACNDCR